MPLTTEGLINTIESNQSLIMFWWRGDINENIIRNSTGQLARLGRALNKYPPVYWYDDYERMDLHKLLTKQQITFITSYDYALTNAKKMKPPKCRDLFMTVIDGIQTCVL